MWFFVCFGGGVVWCGVGWCGVVWCGVGRGAIFGLFGHLSSVCSRICGIANLEGGEITKVIRSTRSYFQAGVTVMSVFL